MDTPAGFEWDDAKATANYQKHGVTFDAAMHVFGDGARLDVADMRRNYGEERRNATGMVDGLCLTVAYTLRADRSIRIISARRASKKERQAYGHSP